MILGAGQLQIAAIKTARSMGLEVVTLDRNKNAPGALYATYAVPVDFMDREASVQIAKDYHIDGVLTVSSDLPVPTIGRIVDAMGLVGISESTGDICANKLLMRSAFQKHGIPSPRCVEASNEQEAVFESGNLRFPLMVKAVDSSGSRGVHKAEKRADIKEAFKGAQEHSRCGKVCIEEFVEGIEFGAQAVVVNGEILLMLLHNDTVSDPPYYVPIGHSFPFSQNGFDLNLIDEIAREAIKAVGIANGGVNLDLIYGESGPQVIEIGARLGGTCLPELIYEYSGIDILQKIIRIALGEPQDLVIRKKQPVAALLITSNRSGIVKQIEIPKSVYDISRLIDLSFDIGIGAEVKRFTSGPDRIGQIIAKGDCALHAEELVKMIGSTVNVDIV